MAYAAVRPRPHVGPWGRRVGLAMRAISALSALALLGGLMWHAYGQGQSGGDARTIPLLRAEAGPIKTRPKEPGGLRVPHRDKRVYERLTPGRRKVGTGKVERLIPRPDPGRLPPNAAKVKKRPAAKPKVAGGPAKVRIAARRRASKKAPARLPVAKSRAAAGRFRVQIAAYKTPQLAARRWQRLKGRHKDLVGKLDWYVEKVNRSGGRGPLYRLQLGPLKDPRAARQLCAQLGKRKVSCLFVRG